MTGRPAVVDTNVVVAGLLTRDPVAPTARILDGMLGGEFPFVVSLQLVAEFREVLLRPRIRQRHGLEPSEIDEMLTAIVANAMVREPEPGDAAGEDLGDQHLRDLLAAIPTAILVTGDAALLRKAPTDASGLSPRAWLESR